MKRILVVDDDRTTRHLLRALLKKAGYQVATAQDGVEALRKIEKGGFDLVVADVWMPRMNGLEMLARLRAEGRQARVVVMTSDSTPETLLRAVREQAFQYLTKPIQAAELLEIVESALQAEALPPIEVLSARPDWVELLVPCAIEAAERIQGIMAHLDTDLPADVRGAVAQVFREMLLNAVEWGGQLDPNRKVRIAYLRARRMLLYRIADPGPGFNFEDIPHAAVSYEPDKRMDYVSVRLEKGMRPGGFGILMARAMVDELLYNEAHNEVVFVKYLD